MGRLTLVLIFSAIAIIILWTSTQDTYEEQREAAHYQKMVCAGHWPDYRNEKPECN